ncbi:Rv3235 family protein [Streptomyces sp. H10-C2]|uniref:Rv3235 family protein n=1 Tax=unclassified Streptomyces TaxID=2593676 RepID=UPI0024B9A3EC|nr:MULTISPECIES: Rv3235 family protein [unclassified Streptomyces]MDJ0345728.1 Rv3235 family protein [Streptomyces sp. PH10-H1]MDJ0374579.1 Rv3235 family protein [Streptomyces sp. H10-C2]
MAVTSPASTRPGPGPGRSHRAGPPNRHDHRRPAVRADRRTAVPPHLWFADRLLTVLTGRQPISCLAGRVRGTAYDRLWELVNSRADWRRRAHGQAPYVHSCQVARQHDGALEVTAVVALTHDTFRAIAFRLERGPTGGGTGDGTRGGAGGRTGADVWRCTAVEAR